MLISTAQLHANLQNPDWVMFDCRHGLTDLECGARSYAEAHIPGAHFVPFETALAGEKTGRNGRHPLPHAVEFAAFLNEHGVSPGSQIVAYDDSGGAYAARLWWLARWIGLTKAAVLDGGLNKWRAEGHPMTAEVPFSRERGRVVPRPNPGVLRSAADVLAAVRNDTALVVDARSPERFRGESEPIDKVAGHIPKAVNRPFKDNLMPDLTMRPAAELRPEFEQLLNGTPPARVIHQCGSGVTACLNLLAMEHAGLSGSTLYVGSWSEWCSDPTRPVARGA